MLVSPIPSLQTSFAPIISHWPSLCPFNIHHSSLPIMPNYMRPLPIAWKSFPIPVIFGEIYLHGYLFNLPMYIRTMVSIELEIKTQGLVLKVPPYMLQQPLLRSCIPLVNSLTTSCTYICRSPCSSSQINLR